MKNKFAVLFLAFFTALFIGGCASSGVARNSGIIKSSDPIFITNLPEQKLVNVAFTNTSNFDSNLTTEIENYLTQDGYSVVSKDKANILIEGNLNYFRRIAYKDNRFRPTFGFGFGMGRFSRHFGLGMGMGFPFGWDLDDDYYGVTSYIYDGQLSLLIRVKNGKEFKDYATNLNYQSEPDAGSVARVTDSFNYKVYQQIKQILSRQNDN